MPEIPTTTMRINPELKEAARPILSELGLNMTEAITMFLRALVRENGLPFKVNDVLKRNATSVTGNTNLNQAGKAKKDEFYTLYEDIDKEMEHHLDSFRKKVVLCNCDDPFESNFFKYFVINFNRLGISKLVCSGYARAAQDVNSRDLVAIPALKAVVTNVTNRCIDLSNESIDMDSLFSSEGNLLTRLDGDGDFRSAECLQLLNEADIVVTNPPFSLFREYVSILIGRHKKFLIIGNINAVTYKEVFPYIKDNMVWLGASIHSGDRKFYVPEEYEMNAAGCGVDENGRGFIRVKGVRWFTNLDYQERHDAHEFLYTYDPALYPKYDNYNAIEVGRTNRIPRDYNGVMGVPITYIDKHNPDDYEIIMLANGNARTSVDEETLSSVGYRRHPEDRGGVGIINGKRAYARMLIRRRVA